MHPADIKAAIAKKGLTHKKLIEDTHHVNKSIVSHVIHSRCRSRFMEQRISEITGYSLHRLWPQWYSKNNEPRQA